MNKQKTFNIGDRVRIVADMEQPYYMWVEKGDTGVIVEGKAAKGYECVKIDGCANMTYVCVESKYLETDVTYDPKTAFLSDLAAVLRKHNAVINVDWNDGWQADDAKYPLIDMDILFNDSVEGICLEDVLGKTLTADNLMNYDKE